MSHDASVLLLSHRNEPFCTARVAGALAARGVRVLRLDTDTFPSTLDLRAELGPDPTGQPQARLLYQGEALAVSAVWLWRIWPASLDPRLPPEQAQAAVRESMVTLRGLLDLTPSQAWIDPPDAVVAGENKTRQLRLAQAVGLSIPPTLITADPEAARAFYHAHAGRVVAKLQSSLGYSMRGGGLPTRLLRPQDLPALEGLRSCPMIFQRYVEKAYELRIAWVDGQAFVGALDGAQCGVDWRYESTASWQPYDLPAAVQQKLAALMARLSLRQGAVDLIVTPGDEYVFLEVNPHGEWGMLERDLGLPIGAALADALLRRPKTANAAANEGAR